MSLNATKIKRAGKAKVIPSDKLLLPFQSKWVMDKSRLKLGEKGRQLGWTWSEAYAIVRDKSPVDAKLDHWISSRDEIQARLFLGDCKGFAGLLQIGAEDLGERAIDDEGNTAYSLQFANGLRANSMSSNPDAQAGKSIRIPDNPSMVSDIRGIRKETTAAGNIRFSGERSESGHCDRFWGLALALHAGKNPGSHYAGILI